MSFIVIAVYIVVALLGLTLLAMIIFGARSVAFGKINPLTMAINCIPIVLLVILGFVMGDWALAGIWTIAITLGLALLALLVTGIKGLFS